jgi:hypothetical protein
VIVWLASYPRSGNTFLRILLRFGFGIQTYSAYDDPLFDQYEGMAEAVGHAPLPAPLAELKASADVFFVKTHDLPGDDSPAIHVVRDGRDALVSHARYLVAFHRRRALTRRTDRLLGLDPFPGVLRRLVTETHRYGGWSGHTRAWRTRPATTITLRYEDLLQQDPLRHVAEALERGRFALPVVTRKALPCFDQLHARWPNFFRRGTTGAWRQEMPARVHEQFWRIHGTEMAALGYLRTPTVAGEG